MFALSSRLHTFALNGHSRQYLTDTLPFENARRILKADPYSAKTGKGEQRRLYDNYAKKLRREMEAGRYSPAVLTASAKNPQLTTESGLTCLSVDPKKPLSLLDGQQRLGALELMWRQAEKDQNEEAMNEIGALPVTLVVYLDGDTKLDFLNLNAGKTVDATLAFSLRVATGTLPGPKTRALTAKMAVKVATAADANVLSPFFRSVRFDDADQKDRLPVSTLVARGAGDLSTSLIGVQLACGMNNENDVVDLLGDCLSAVRLHCPEQMGAGMALAYGGERTKGSMTMYNGLAVCLGYWMKHKRVVRAGEEEKKRLGLAVKAAWADAVGVDFSTGTKRELMRELAKAFFDGDSEFSYHEGVPKGLVELLSASAFAVGKLSKATKAPKKTNPVAVPTPLVEQESTPSLQNEPQFAAAFEKLVEEAPSAPVPTHIDGVPYEPPVEHGPNDEAILAYYAKDRPELETPDQFLARCREIRKERPKPWNCTGPVTDGFMTYKYRFEDLPIHFHDAAYPWVWTEDPKHCEVQPPSDAIIKILKDECYRRDSEDAERWRKLRAEKRKAEEAAEAAKKAEDAKKPRVDPWRTGSFALDWKG